MLKKVFTVLVAVALTASFAQAQRDESKIRWGIHLGMGGNGVYGVDSKYQEAEEYDDARPRLGMQLGVVAEYGLTDDITLHSGFIFDGQGYKANDKKCRLHYIRIPVNAQYSLPVGKHALVFKAGPYLGLAYTGNYSNTVIGALGNATTMGATFENEFHFGNKENYTEIIEGGEDKYIEHSYFKRIDVGVDFGAGFRFNDRFQLGWEYSIGFMPISKTFGYKNRSFNFTCTWMLGKK
jgi:hypothetical protein